MGAGANSLGGVAIGLLALFVLADPNRAQCGRGIPSGDGIFIACAPFGRLDSRHMLLRALAKPFLRGLC